MLIQTISGVVTLTKIQFLETNPLNCFQKKHKNKHL